MSRSPLMDQEFRPVAIVALALTIVPLAATVYFLRLHRPTFHIPLLFFIFVNMLNGIVLIGVLRRRKWGYRLFRILLYMLLFGLPIGTVVSYATLSYIRNHRIEQQFGLPASNQIFQRTWLVVTFAAVAVGLFLWMMLAY